MGNIVFIDTEVDFKSKKILDLGATTHNGLDFHAKSLTDFFAFIQRKEYVCGHNIINHDW